MVEAAVVGYLRGILGLSAWVLAGCTFSGAGTTQTGEDTDGSGGSSSGEDTGSPTTTAAPTTSATAGASTSTTDAEGSSSAASTTTTGPGETTVEATSGGSTSTTTAAETTGPAGTSEPGTSTGECEPQTWYLDMDDDGVGLEGEAMMACEQPDGYAPIAGDCDDGDAKVSPLLEELCDSQDNDCDMLADEWSPSNGECGGCKLVPDDPDAPTKVYYYCAAGLQWMAARNSCMSKGAALVADEQAAEHTVLVAGVDGFDPGLGPWWTGGHQQGGNFVAYEWLDGTNLAGNDPRWGVIPVVLGGKCVRLHPTMVMPGGKWSDAQCNEPHPYVCELDL